MLELQKVNPWRRRRILTLQNQVWRAESFVTWLRELVVSGRQAEAALEESEHGS